MQKAPFELRVIEHLAGRIFSCSVSLRVELVSEGVSTYVYRIRRAGETFYLRVLPEAECRKDHKFASTDALSRQKDADFPGLIPNER